jgi:hypothetical protein
MAMDVKIEILIQGEYSLKMTEIVLRHYEAMLHELGNPAAIKYSCLPNVPSDVELQAAKFRLSMLPVMEKEAQHWQDTGEPTLARHAWASYHKMREQQEAFEEKYRSYLDEKKR